MDFIAVNTVLRVCHWRGLVYALSVGQLERPCWLLSSIPRFCAMINNTVDGWWTTGRKYIFTLNGVVRSNNLPSTNFIGESPPSPFRSHFQLIHVRTNFTGRSPWLFSWRHGQTSARGRSLHRWYNLISYRGMTNMDVVLNFPDRFRTTKLSGK